MDSYKYKFSNDKDLDFSRTLRNRVNDYFKSNNINIYANANMVFKTIFMTSLYIFPLILMLTGTVINHWLIILMWILMGLGKGGIGMGIMHDANHGAYSRNAKINFLLSYSMNLIGANSVIWKYQHNVLHHIYTNIEGSDDDILPPPFLRFSPYQKKYWFHRFQHIYVWLTYSLTTLSWVSTRNYIQAIKFKKIGLIKNNTHLFKEILQISIWKIVYFSYILVLPIFLIPVSPLLIILGFVIMHLVTGFILSTIFQTAHVMPSTEFPEPNPEKKIMDSWMVHQLKTTTNFGHKNSIFSWLIGGLNHQVEHHLFSNICHVHYGKISEIVSETAKEFNIQYNAQKNFIQAIRNHTRMMRYLGKSEQAIT